MRYETPLLRRFFTKFVLDILPAALASAIGGFVLTHYGLGRAQEPAAAQVAPASAEMMQLLRDEHGLIVNFLAAQIAKQKKQLAEEGAPRAAADSESATAAATPPRVAVAMAATKPTTPRGRTPVVGASLAPLAIAGEQQHESGKPAAGNPDSLFARTIGIKDNVVAVTHRVVSVIYGIPSWIGGIGEHIGGDDATPPRPPADLVSAS